MHRSLISDCNAKASLEDTLTMEVLEPGLVSPLVSLLVLVLVGYNR